MKTLLLKNASTVLPDEILDNSNILIENGIIREISQKNFAADEVVDLENNKLFSGFIDIHNHGAVGFDVNESSTDDLIQIAKFLVNQGITAWLPTLVPDSVENYQNAIDAIDKLIEYLTLSELWFSIVIPFFSLHINKKKQKI